MAHSALSGRRTRLDSHNRRSGFSICWHTSGNTFSFLVSLRVDLSHSCPHFPLPLVPSEVSRKARLKAIFSPAVAVARIAIVPSILLSLSRYLSIHLIDGNARSYYPVTRFEMTHRSCKSERRSIEGLVD